MTSSLRLLPNPTQIGSTIIDILDYRATHQGDRLAYEFYTGTNKPNDKLTYKELAQKAKAIAGELISRNLPGERVLLIYPGGLEFITAFMGCLYAGAIAVPLYPPTRNQRRSRIEGIIADCDAKGILTISQLSNRIKDNLVNTKTSLEYIFTDSLGVLENRYRIAKSAANSLAFLQYTSGSTGNPKGVKITHQNIIANSKFIYQSFEHSVNSKVVSWLPFYHDMGLIGGILQPLFGGFPVSLFSPTDFIRQPLLWLETISKFEATTSGAPNFAYEMCVAKITSEDKKKLDLSSWNLAFIGAEPIHAETLDKFTEAFKECGFDKSAFYPCYGMAEATLMISGGVKDSLPVVVNHDDKSIVGCETIIAERSVIIVDPNSKTRCQPEKIGEIWIKDNDSIADGYWNNKRLTNEIFKAKVDSGNKNYLRTGDLGFIKHNELFVTGRIKDVIIIRGQNYYPQDIEKVVERSHSALKVNSGAAFSIEVGGKEQLVVVQEVERSFVRKLGIYNNSSSNLSSNSSTAKRGEQELITEIENAIQAGISKEFGLNIYDIQLVKTGSISKTSSGKIQHYLCRERYLEAAQMSRDTVEEGNKRDRQVEEIISWLRDYAQENINSQIIDERRCIPPHIVLDFGNQGLLGMQVPEKYGGLGLNNHQTMQILEQLGAIDTTLCLFVGLNNILGIRPILNYGSEKLKQELLPILATGRELAAFALTEKNAGSNPQTIVSQAVATSQNSWNIKGEKIWSGSAAWAGVTNVFVRHQNLNGDRQGISAFALRRGTPGLRQGQEALTMGMKGMVQNTVYFDDVSVSRQQLLGKPGKGMEVAQDAMMYGRLAIAFSCLGGMKRCAQLMLRYTSRRQVSTGRLLDNPVVLARLGGLTAQITAVECLVTQIARLLDGDITIPVELYTACKTSAPEFYWQAADDLVQFLGGRGYIETNIAPQILRDARVLRIFEGPTETLNMFLGSRIVSCDKFAENDFIGFIRETFGSADVYGQLSEAVERIEGHFDKNPVFDKSIDNKRWVYSLVGEIATYAILLAATKYSYSLNPSTEIRRAIAWVKLEFEQKIDNALTVTSNGLVTETADISSELINSYQQAIGNIEQSLPGEDREIDRILTRDNFSSVSLERKAVFAVVDPKADIHPPSSPTTEGEKNQSIQDWLSRWLSNKLQIPENKIDRTKSFADYGIDSVMAVELAQDLEEWLPDDLEVEPTLAWSFPSIEALAGYLVRVQSHEIPHQPIGEQGNRPNRKQGEIDTLSEDELAKSLLQEIALAQGRNI